VLEYPSPHASRAAYETRRIALTGLIVGERLAELGVSSVPRATSYEGAVLNSSSSVQVYFEWAAFSEYPARALNASQQASAQTLASPGCAPLPGMSTPWLDPIGVLERWGGPCRSLSSPTALSACQAVNREGLLP
jgi:hypothetical protein